MGEKLDAIEVFHPERMASRILGMGDVLSLIEKAQETLDEKKAAELEKKIRKNRFTLQDFYDQIQETKKMGSVGDILGKLPGLSGKVDESQLDNHMFDKTEAIILSMTKKEREDVNPVSYTHLDVYKRQGQQSFVERQPQQFLLHGAVIPAGSAGVPTPATPAQLAVSHGNIPCQHIGLHQITLGVMGCLLYTSRCV